MNHDDEHEHEIMGGMVALTLMIISLFAWFLGFGCGWLAGWLLWGR